MSIVKTQHYVPRFYLKNFMDSYNKIWVYDKKKKKTFNPSIINIACENYFYDNKELDKTYDEQQYLEKLYSQIEAKFAPQFHEFIKKIISNDDEVINSNDKEIIANYFVSQIDRTKEHREESEQSYYNSRKYFQENGINENQLTQMGFNEEKMDAKDFHLESIIYGLENVDMFSEMLCDHIWVIIKNETPQLFFTSDNPIVKYAHIKGNDGFASPGIEIVYPLTPNYLLVLFEREYFLTFEKHENKQLLITDMNRINNYNSFQVMSSYRQVYSKNDCFELIEKLIKSKPDAFDINRNRM